MTFHPQVRHWPVLAGILVFPFDYLSSQRSARRFLCSVMLSAADCPLSTDFALAYGNELTRMRALARLEAVPAPYGLNRDPHMCVVPFCWPDAGLRHS